MSTCLLISYLNTIQSLTELNNSNNYDSYVKIENKLIQQYGGENDNKEFELKVPGEFINSPEVFKKIKERLTKIWILMIHHHFPLNLRKIIALKNV